jgi:hypothetical protein
VKTKYRAARFTLDRKGMSLFYSPPPTAKRMHLISRSSS